MYLSVCSFDHSSVCLKVLFHLFIDHFSVCLKVLCSFNHLTIRLCVQKSFFRLIIWLFVCVSKSPLSICVFDHLSVCPKVLCSFVHLTIRLCVQMSFVCLIIWPFVCVSKSPFVRLTKHVKVKFEFPWAPQFRGKNRSRSSFGNRFDLMEITLRKKNDYELFYSNIYNILSDT